jgi:hypothetical protein
VQRRLSICTSIKMCVVASRLALQAELCKFLVQNSRTEELAVLSLTLRVVFNLFNCMKRHLKVQLEVFFTSVHLCISNSRSARAEHRELALESLLVRGHPSFSSLLLPSPPFSSLLLPSPPFSSLLLPSPPFSSIAVTVVVVACVTRCNRLTPTSFVGVFICDVDDWRRVCLFTTCSPPCFPPPPSPCRPSEFLCSYLLVPVLCRSFVGSLP